MTAAHTKNLWEVLSNWSALETQAELILELKKKTILDLTLGELRSVRLFVFNFQTFSHTCWKDSKLKF